MAKAKPSGKGKPPDEVEVVNEGPLLVTVEAPPAPPAPEPIKKPDGTLSLPPTTTEQEDIVTAGQRAINLIWENTQSWIALGVVFTGLTLNTVVVFLIIIFNREVTVPQLSLISICLQFINLTVGIVIGFYFSRTNHQATGGTGKKPEMPPYTGR